MLLDQEVREALKSYLAHVANPVDLVLALDDSPAAQQLRELAQTLTELNALIRVREATEGEVALGRRPALGVASLGAAPRVHFAGVPLGHELSSLVLAILHISGHPPKEEAALLEAARSLTGSYQLEVFVSLTCHNCPDVVQAANLIAALNPRVQSVMVDGALFQREAEERDVLAVPTLFANGKRIAQGRLTLGELLRLLEPRSEAAEAERIAALRPFDVLVVGGGPAGAAAAIYAARKGIRTGIVAERLGGQVLDTAGIENFISLTYTTGEKLARDMRAHLNHYGVEILEGVRADGLQPAQDGLWSVQLGALGSVQARTVVLALGARWRSLNVPGEEQYRTRGVAYCPHCDGPFFKGMPVAVIGGGNSGVEAAIDLAGICSEVVLLEFMPELKADAVLQERLKSLANVRVLCNAQTLEILGDGRRVTGLRYRDRASGAESELAVAGVFVQIGLAPNTDWLRERVALNRFGEIEIDARCATSLPGVFAAGDCTTVPYKQIIIAMGEGAKAALSAFDYLIRHA